MEEEREEMCDGDEQIVGECVEVWCQETGADDEEVPVSEEHENDDEADMEGASDSSDTVDTGKLCKQWEKYPIGHKLVR